MVEDQWENRTIEPKPALLVDSYPEVKNLDEIEEEMDLLPFRAAGCSLNICGGAL